MRLKLALVAALASAVAVVTGLTVPPTASADTVATDVNLIPVQGTIASIDGTFSGIADIDRFALENGQLVALGTLTGTARDASGAVIESVSGEPMKTAVESDAGSCQILDLSIGAIHLDVLGLVVHLDPVHLNISAVPGSGNLLGNLVCMIANLLNGTSTTFAQPYVNLLNRVLFES